MRLRERAGRRASEELIKIYRGVKLRQGETRRLLMRKLTVFWPLWANESMSIIAMIATLKSYDVKTWTLKVNIARFSPHVEVIYLCQLHLVQLVAFAVGMISRAVEQALRRAAIRIRNFKIN